MGLRVGVFVGVVLFAAAGGFGQGIGGVQGEANFVGAVPAGEPHRIGGDDFCEEIHEQQPIMKQGLVVSADKKLKNVVVWVVEGWPEGKKPGVNFKEPVSMVQQGCQLVPHVLAIQAGQPIVVQNGDPTIQNLNFAPANNPAANVVLEPASKPMQLQFEKPEVGIRLRSAIHPWMQAWVVVLDHPAYYVTGEDGRFEIGGLPAGEYKLAAWHEKLGQTEAEVLVKEGEPAEVTFTFTNTGSRSGDQQTKTIAEQTTAPM